MRFALKNSDFCNTNIFSHASHTKIQLNIVNPSYWAVSLITPAALKSSEEPLRSPEELHLGQASWAEECLAIGNHWYRAPETPSPITCGHPKLKKKTAQNTLQSPDRLNFSVSAAAVCDSRLMVEGPTVGLLLLCPAVRALKVPRQSLAVRLSTSCVWVGRAPGEHPGAHFAHSQPKQSKVLAVTAQHWAAAAPHTACKSRKIGDYSTSVSMSPNTLPAHVQHLLAQVLSIF